MKRPIVALGVIAIVALAGCSGGPSQSTPATASDSTNSTDNQPALTAFPSVFDSTTTIVLPKNATLAEQNTAKQLAAIINPAGANSETPEIKRVSSPDELPGGDIIAVGSQRWQIVSHLQETETALQTSSDSTKRARGQLAIANDSNGRTVLLVSGHDQFGVRASVNTLVEAPPNDAVANPDYNAFSTVVNTTSYLLSSDIKANISASLGSDIKIHAQEYMSYTNESVDLTPANQSWLIYQINVIYMNQTISNQTVRDLRAHGIVVLNDPSSFPLSSYKAYVPVGSLPWLVEQPNVTRIEDKPDYSLTGKQP